MTFAADEAQIHYYSLSPTLPKLKMVVVTYSSDARASKVGTYRTGDWLLHALSIV